MRILIITPIYPPETGGAATNYSLLMRELIKREDIEFVVVLSRFRSWREVHSRNGKMTLIRLMLVPRVISKFNVLILFVNYLVLLIVIPVLVSVFKIDVIHYHQQAVYKAMELLGGLLGIPRIIDKRDLGKALPRPRAYDRMICASQNIVTLVQHRGVPAEKTLYIPIIFIPPTPLIPAQLEVLSSRFSLPDRYLLFLGDIIFYKGIYELLDAFKLLSRRYPGLALVLAGANREGRKFANCINTMNRIYYLGEVEHCEALALIQQSEFLVLPSKSEGLPRAVLEAMALGVRCALPSCVPEFVQACKEFTLSYRDSGELAMELERIMHLPHGPRYSFSGHQPAMVARATVKLYKDALFGNSHKKGERQAT